MSQAKIEEAKQLIQKISKQGKVIVNFSGGRDSLTVLLLTREVMDPTAWFMRSSIELPGTIKYVQDVCRRLNTPLLFSNPEEYQGDFYTQVKRWGYFPTLQKPWCNGRLKIRPQRAKMRQLWGYQRVYKLTGIRKSESARRLYRYSKSVVEADPEHRGSFMVHVIVDWTQKDVSNFLESRGMALHKGYKICGVSGCFWCPFYQPSICLRINHAFPGIYDRIISLEKQLGKPSLQGHRYLYNVLKQTSLPSFPPRALQQKAK